MRKRSLCPSEGQCSNSRNIDPAILPRPKFSNDWHPGTDHMPFARPPSHAETDIRHAACVSHGYCMRSYRIVNTCFIIFHLTGNVFSNLSPISVDTSLFGSRRTKMSMNRSARGRTERVKSVMWEIKYVPREKIDGMLLWIFQIFTRVAFTLYLLSEKNRIGWYSSVPNPPHISSILERI